MARMRKQKKVEYVEKIVEVEKPVVPGVPAHEVVNKALGVAEKSFAAKLVPYIYTIWKLEHKLKELNQAYKTFRIEKTREVQPLVITEKEPPTEEFQQLISIHNSLMSF